MTSEAMERANAELKAWMKKHAFPKADIQSITETAHRLYTAACEQLQARITELEQALAQEKHQAEVYRLEMVKAQELVEHLKKQMQWNEG